MPCTEKACLRLAFHFIPDKWWREQKSAAADAVVGQVLGDFLVVGFIGAGGFGRVYLVLQAPIFRLKGALKLLELPSTNAVVVNAMLQKFRQEAEALAELTHPNIVRLLKYGIHNDRPYLVMEYIDGGRTLREEIWDRARRSKSFTHRELHDILGQVLNALEAAHARSIIHRDIKPENIMIQPVAGHPNHIKILDFGTAKFVEEREDTAWPLGSPSYMAPEQIEMRGIGPWSDLFAVGVLAFELMSGRKPFPGSSEHSIVSKKLDLDYEPLAQLVGLDFPPKTIEFLRQAIAVDAEARYRDVSSFRHGLDIAMTALGTKSSVIGPSGAELTSLLDSGEIVVINQDELPTAVGGDEGSETVPDAGVGPPTLPPTEVDSDPIEDPPVSDFEAELDAISEARGIPDEPSFTLPPPTRRRWPTIVLALGVVGVGVAGTLFYVESQRTTPASEPLVTTPPPPARPDVVVVATPDVALDVGDDASSDASTTRDAGRPLGRISAVTAGKFHSCLALHDGRVRCWGANFDGELGLGHKKSIGDNELPTAEPWIRFVDGVTQIESAGDRGSSFNCVLSMTGDVRCWGTNNFGQLGLGHTGSIGARNRVGGPGHGSVQLGGVAIDVTVGGAQYGSHACALLDDHVVRCWGGNKFGQLGLGHTRNIGDDEQPLRADPVDVGGKTIDIVAGKQHTCAVIEGDHIVCWGFNREGQLGYGHTDHIGDDEKPSAAGIVEVGGKVVKLAAGRAHTCAVLEEGKLRCWGWNKSMQLGYGHTDNIGDDETPADVGFVDVGAPVQSVGLGANHTCALLEDGGIKCWGDNKFGQLGYGHTDPVAIPADVGPIELGAPALALYTGSYHNCAILAGDTLRCWGYNKYGQLGLGHANDIGDDETPIAAPPVAVFDGSEDLE